MKKKCLACGVEKDMDVWETYPYPEDWVTTDEPVPPLFDIECQMGELGGLSDFRVATVCHACFHKLEPDMWISEAGWKALNPVTPANELPELQRE